MMRGKHGLENESEDSPGGSAVWCLPSAQDVILETLDLVPRQAPCMEPTSDSLSLSLCLS